MNQGVECSVLMGLHWRAVGMHQDLVYGVLMDLQWRVM